jgi:hypothetical protein
MSDISDIIDKVNTAHAKKTRNDPGFITKTLFILFFLTIFFNKYIL